MESNNIDLSQNTQEQPQKNSSITQNPKESKENKENKIKINLILYIGNLPANIDNYEVYELIRKFGDFNIETMNIKKTKDNSAYAYVKFKNKKEVEAAKEKLHLSNYKDRIIKADLFRKEDKRMINNLNSNLFFKGFPKDTTIKEVLDLFCQFGEIGSIKPKTTTENKFLGSGYISFKSPECAAEAMLKLNNFTFKEAKISVIKYNKYETRVLNNNFPVVLCRNLPPHIETSEDFKETLSKFCDITLCGIFKEQIETFVNIYGMALLPNAEEVEKCLINSKDSEINFEGIEVVHAEYNKANCDKLIEIKKNSLKKKYEGSNLVVKNIPKDVTEKDLFELFSKFGKVKSAKLSTEGKMKEIKDENGIVMDKQFIYESKGFAYVLMVDNESASKAVEELNNVPYVFKNNSLLLRLEYFNYDRIPQDPKNKRENTKKGVRNERREENLRDNNKEDNIGRGFGNNSGRVPIGGHPMMPHSNQMMMMNNQFNNMQINQQMINNQQNIMNQKLQNQSNTSISNEQAIMIELNYDLNYVQAVITRSQNIQNEEDRNEKLGETLFPYIAKVIEVLKLNTFQSQGITNDTITSKLTGILIQTKFEALIEILSNINIFITTAKDLIFRLYENKA